MVERSLATPLLPAPCGRPEQAGGRELGPRPGPTRTRGCTVALRQTGMWVGRAQASSKETPLTDQPTVKSSQVCGLPRAGVWECGSEGGEVRTGSGWSGAQQVSGPPGVAAQVRWLRAGRGGCEREGLSLAVTRCPLAEARGQAALPPGRSSSDPAVPAGPQAHAHARLLSAQPRPIPVGSPAASRLQCPFMTAVQSEEPVQISPLLH